MANNFYDLYRLGLSRKGWSCSELARQMNRRGIKISERTLQRYKRGESLPTVTGAETIFETLEIEMSSDYLKRLLAEQVPEFDPGYGRNRYINKSVRLRIANLSNEISNDGQIMIALQRRISETQKEDTSSFTKYLEKLIRKDIDEKILPTVRKVRKEKKES